MYDTGLDSMSEQLDLYAHPFGKTQEVESASSARCSAMRCCDLLSSPSSGSASHLDVLHPNQANDPPYLVYTVKMQDQERLRARYWRAGTA